MDDKNKQNGVQGMTGGQSVAQGGVNRGDGEFIKNLENNVDQIKAEQAAGVELEEKMAAQASGANGAAGSGASASGAAGASGAVSAKTWTELMNEEKGERVKITEAEARALIEEDRAKAVAGMKNANAKSKKTLVVVLVVAVVLCVLGAVFAMVMGSRKGGEEAGNNGGDTVVNAPVEPGEETPGDGPASEGDETVKQIVSEMEEALKGYLVQDGEELFSFDNEQASAPAYQVEGTQAVVILNKSIGFTATSKYGSENEEMLYDVVWEKIRDAQYQETIQGVFEREGFVLTGEDWVPGGEYINNETGVICTNIGSGMPIFFGCGKTSWVNESEVELADALAKAYYEKQGSYPGVIDVNRGGIRNSTVSPYQTLNVGLANAVGLFYRVSPEAEWVFFKATQSPLACEEYDTEDLKKAYTGTACYTDGEEMMVGE